MTRGRRTAVAHDLRRLFTEGTLSALTDAELLERVLSGERDAREAAFAAIVERHGPNVLRVCRAVLGDPHAAEDAFQATFLVLARRAGSVRSSGSLASWLHGVALRVGSRARRGEARRRFHERFVARPAETRATEQAPEPSAWLHEELARLRPDFADAIRLCDLEGASLEDAARRLGCPLGTLKSRLSRGRARLRSRLLRRGLDPETLALAWTVDRTWMSGELCRWTARMAVRDLAASAAVATLTEGVIRGMLSVQICRCSAITFLAAVLVTTGAASRDALGPIQAAAAAPVGPPNPVVAIDERDAALDKAIRGWRRFVGDLKTLDVRLTTLTRVKAADFADQSRQLRLFWKAPDQLAIEMRSSPLASELLTRTLIEGTHFESYDFSTRLRRVRDYPESATIAEFIPFHVFTEEQDLRERFQVALVAHPQGDHVLSLVPKRPADRRLFAKAFLKLDGPDFRPTRWFLVMPDGESTRDVTFQHIRINAELPEDAFRKEENGWTLVRSPLQSPPRLPEGLAPAIRLIARPWVR